MSNNPFHPFFGYNRGYDPDMDQVALFIDWDNLVISNYADRGVNRPDLELIVRKAQQYGTLVMARAYAEWQVLVDRLEVYKTGVEPIYAPVFHSNNDLSGQMGRGKSLADPIMVTDCIDFLHLMPQIGTYVLVTGDKDMMPVVRLAKMRGRRVIVIGPDYVANVLQQVSDEFIPYRQLLAQGAYEQYAAYGYTANGAYPPVAGATQLPQQNTPYNQSTFPPTGATTAQSSQERDRRGRRLTGSQNRTRTGQSGYSSQPSYNQTPTPASSYQPENIASFTGQQAYQQYPGTQIPPQAVPGVPPGSYSNNQYGTAQPSYNQPPQGYVPPTQGYVQPSSYLQPGSYNPPPAATSNQSQPAYQGYRPTPAPVTAYQQPTYTPTPTPTQPGVVPFKAPATTERTPGSTYAPPAPVTAQPVPVSASPTATPVEAPRGKAANDFEEIKDLVHNILTQKSANGRGHLRARDLKEEILRRLPNFSERRYGFAKFKAMLSAIEQSGVIQTEQADHIVWVSLPGSPKLPAEVMSDLERHHLTPGGTIMTDDSEDEGDEGEDKPEPVVLEAATAAEPSLADTSDPFVASVVLDSPEALEAATQAPEPVQQTTSRRDTMPNRAAEERKTSLTEATIGAHREQPQRNLAAQPAPAPATTTAVPAGNTGPTFPELGPKPPLLEQSFFYDVIVLVDSLRYRNRWLGYELLLSSVRDYLSKQMSESEAKNQAGTILSRLLSEGVLKPSQEIHSRGPRKMRVLVQHLQEENRAVKYALAAAKLVEQQRKAEAAVPPTVMPEVATAASEPRQSRVHQLMLSQSHSAEVEGALAAETAAIAAPAQAQPEAIVEGPALSNESELPSSMLPTGVIEEQQPAETSDTVAFVEPEVTSSAEAQPVSYAQLVEAAAPHEVLPDGNEPETVTASQPDTSAAYEPPVEAAVSDSQPLTEMQRQDNIPGIDFANLTEDVNQVEQELLQRAAEVLAYSTPNGDEDVVEVVARLVETVPQPGDNDALPTLVVLVSNHSEVSEVTEEPADESDGVEAEPEGEAAQVVAPTRRPRRRRSSPAVHKIPAGDELA